MSVTRPLPKKNASYASNRLSTHIPDEWSLHGKRLRSQDSPRNRPTVEPAKEHSRHTTPAKDSPPIDAPPKSDSESENDAAEGLKDHSTIRFIAPIDKQGPPTFKNGQSSRRSYGAKKLFSKSGDSSNSCVPPISSRNSGDSNLEGGDEQLDAWVMETQQPAKKRKLNGSVYGFQSKFRPPAASIGESRRSLKDEEPVFRTPLLPELGPENSGDQPVFKSTKVKTPELGRRTRSGAMETADPAFQKREADPTLTRKLDKGEHVAGDVFKARDVEKMIQDLPPNSSTSSLSTATSTFSAPPIFDDEDAHSAVASPLSTPPDSPELLALQADIDDFPILTKCPICREPVPLADLEAFAKGPRGCRLDIHSQQKFCAQHTASDAQSLYFSRGYPRFTPESWDVLAKERIPSHFAHLSRIVNNETPSHFRAMLNRVDQTNNKILLRNFLRDLSIDLPPPPPSSSPSISGFNHSSDKSIRHVVTPGYYGPRGRAIMASTLIERFSPDLNALAARDPLVKRIGVAGYVQTVLVPELAVRLVVEDRREGKEAGKDAKHDEEEEEARRVLEESAEIGERLNGEEEVVEDENEGEGEGEGEGATGTGTALMSEHE